MRFPSNAECAHAPIVEALHDGRLGAQEKASIERHLATCATCAAHRQWLLTIREHVRVPPIDTADPSPLEHQRARSALLRKAVNLDASNRTVSSPLRAWAVPFAAVAFVALALFVGWSWGRSSVPAAVARASATVSEPRAQSTVDPESGARFERARLGDLDEVKLSTGTLRVRAASAGVGARLVVRVGGAVVQPKGGVFRVTAEDGEIRSVVVEEGSVELEVAGYYAEIPAGGSWRAPAVTAAVSSARAPSASPPSASASPPVAIVEPPAKAAPVVDAPPAPKDPSPAVRAPSPPPKKTSGFSSAMRSIDAGDYDAAAEQMAEFSKAHPSDPRADEADYMRAIALERAGRSAEAKAAAQHYLAAWPSGAHRAEAASIASR